MPERLNSNMRNAGRAVRITYGFNGDDSRVVTTCNISEIEKIWSAMLSAAPKPCGE